MCKTIYALLILIFIFIVLNWLKTRETFSSSCKYDVSTSNSGFNIIDKIEGVLKEDIVATCTRNPSCQYYDYFEPAPNTGAPATGTGLLRSCKKATSDISDIKINKIKISLDKNEYLQLGEVEVISKDKNTNLIRPSAEQYEQVSGVPISDFGNADQIDSLFSTSTANKAVNGNKGGNLDVDEIAHTSNKQNPWWTFEWNTPINLSDIKEIKIYNRTDGSNDVKKRIDGAKVELLMDSKVIKTFPLLKYSSVHNIYDFPINYQQYKKECKTPKSNSNIFSDGIKRTDPVKREPKQANNMFGAVFNVRQGKSFLSSKLN